VAVYFFDTSALVKRYAQEVGTAWVNGITDPSASHSVYIARITGAEVVAAVKRKERNRQISGVDATTMIADFRHDFANQYSVFEITPNIITRAMALAEAHPLRGYDAVQLAVAVEINLEGISIGLPALTLVCADHDLNAAAGAEGLVVEDPNNNP
jgi:predicted nucleic acid-binding protein